MPIDVDPLSRDLRALRHGRDHPALADRPGDACRDRARLVDARHPQTAGGRTRRLVQSAQVDRPDAGASDRITTDLAAAVSRHRRCRRHCPPGRSPRLAGQSWLDVRLHARDADQRLPRVDLLRLPDQVVRRHAARLGMEGRRDQGCNEHLALRRVLAAHRADRPAPRGGAEAPSGRPRRSIRAHAAAPRRPRPAVAPGQGA